MNVCSVLNKVDEISELLISTDLCLLTETWLKQDTTIGAWSQGFQCYRSDRLNKVGGGCLLLVRQDIKQSSASFMDTTSNIQSVACLLHTNPPVMVVGIYRCPSSSPQDDDLLIVATEKAYRTGYRLLILGDFNCPRINWSDSTASGCNFDRKVLNTINSLMLFQHVREPTRFRPGHKPSLLDLIITRNGNDLAELRTGAPLGKSDHISIHFSFNGLTPPRPKTAVRQFHAIDTESLIMDAESLSWDSSGCVNDLWVRLSRNITGLTERHVPKKSSGSRGCKPWFRPKVRRAINAKYKAWRSFSRNKSHHLYMKYKRLRNKAIKTSRNARMAYELKIAKQSTANPKRYFGYVQSRTSSRKEIGNALLVDGTLLKSDEAIANAFMSFFQSVYRPDSMKHWPAPNRMNFMSDFVITHTDIDAAFRSLKVSKSCGPDDIHPAILKPLISIVGPLLLELFNATLTSGRIPDSWKTAIVVPIFKDGVRSSPSNYRPISLTSIVAKMFERILRDKICRYLVDTGYFSDHQHGFLKGKSCLTNLLGFFDVITDKLDRGQQVEVCYLDFQKAFDSVNHRLLDWKLHEAGLNEATRKWIASFLSERNYRVRVRESLSRTESPSSGVPQGSILAPLLFVIYVNDITVGLENPCFLYADDLKLVGTSNDSESLQTDILRICEWSIKWDLPLNALKSQMLSKMTHAIPYFVTDSSGQRTNLPVVAQTNDLGIRVANSFTPTTTSEAAAAKARRALFQLKTAIVNKNPEVFVPLYAAFVRPHLEYCVQAWSPYLRKDIQLLEKVQRLATRMIRGMKGMNYEDRLKALNLFSLERRRLRGDLIEVYKAVGSSDGNSIRQLFEFRQDRRLRGHNCTLSKTRNRLAVRQHFFTNRVINAWNSLPPTLVECSSVDGFKLGLDRIWKTLFPDLV